LRSFFGGGGPLTGRPGAHAPAKTWPWTVGVMDVVGVVVVWVIHVVAVVVVILDILFITSCVSNRSCVSFHIQVHPGVFLWLQHAYERILCFYMVFDVLGSFEKITRFTKVLRKSGRPIIKIITLISVLTYELWLPHVFSKMLEMKIWWKYGDKLASETSNCTVTVA